MCHGADGIGNTPANEALKALDFHDSAVIKMTDAELDMIISKEKGKMSVHEDKPTTSEIKSMVVYIRTLQSK
jgi:cytochrome c6